MTSNNKGNKKIKIESEEEADVLETETILSASHHAVPPKLKNKRRIGKLHHAIKVKSGMVKKRKSKAQNDSANEDQAQALLAGCVVQRFAGYSAPSLFGK